MASRLQTPRVAGGAARSRDLPEDEVQAICDRIASSYVPWQESTFPGLLGNVVAGRIANRLDLGGTNCVTDAACASAFSALSMAVSELYLGDADLVISGGVDTLNDIFMYMCFSKTPALSPTGDCRSPFDQLPPTARCWAKGMGIVALKRLEDAERDGDRIYAVIRGLGLVVGRSRQERLRAGAAGQAQGAARAYESAGYGPDSVELVEAHGTGTKVGDATEISALAEVYAAAGRTGPWCARRLDQVADRPHQGRRGRRWSLQGGAGAAPQGAAAKHQDRQAEPGARSGSQPLLSQQRDAPVDPRRRSSAPRRGELASASAGATSTSRWRSTRGPASRRACALVPDELVLLGGDAGRWRRSAHSRGRGWAAGPSGARAHLAEGGRALAPARAWPVVASR